MSFSDWIYSSYPNPGINGQWGLLHIIVLVLCIALIVAFALIFRKRSLRTRRIVIWVLVGLILFFEIARRVINLIKLNGGGILAIIYIVCFLVHGVLSLVGLSLLRQFSTKNFCITLRQ